MSITIELRPKAEKWLTEQASRRGMRPADLVTEIVERAVPRWGEPVSDSEFERLLDEMALDDPSLPILTRDIDHREFYYQGHD